MTSKAELTTHSMRMRISLSFSLALRRIDSIVPWLVPNPLANRQCRARIWKVRLVLVLDLCVGYRSMGRKDDPPRRADERLQ